MRGKYIYIITPVAAILIILILYFSFVYNPYQIKSVEEQNSFLTLNIPSNTVGGNINITSNKSIAIINNNNTLSTYIWISAFMVKGYNNKNYEVVIAIYYVIQLGINDSFNPNSLKFTMYHPKFLYFNCWYDFIKLKDASIVNIQYTYYYFNASFHLNQSSNTPRSYYIGIPGEVDFPVNGSSPLSFPIYFTASIPSFSKEIKSGIVLNVIYS